MKNLSKKQIEMLKKIVIGLVFLLMIILNFTFNNIKEDFSKNSVEETIKDANKFLPIKINEELEMSGIALIKNVFTYTYRFLNPGYYLKNDAKKNFIHAVCNNVFELGLMNKGYVIGLNFNDLNGKSLSKFRINKSDCL